jgi:hypothetical protein
MHLLINADINAEHACTKYAAGTGPPDFRAGHSVNQYIFDTYCHTRSASKSKTYGASDSTPRAYPARISSYCYRLTIV